VKTTVLRCLALTALLAITTIPLEAQRRPAARSTASASTYRPRIGGHIGYNLDIEEGLLGAQAAFALAPRVDLYPSFDIYLVSGGSIWALNLDARFRPPMRNLVAYVGGGLNYMRFSGGGFSNSDTNLNLLGGFESNRMRSVAPYVEGRFILGNGSSFQIVGGLGFKLR
jgi:hypothetical protein